MKILIVQAGVEIVDSLRRINNNNASRQSLFRPVNLLGKGAISFPTLNQKVGGILFNISAIGLLKSSATADRISDYDLDQGMFGR